jgi:NTP pyrophosphatase (non-canonical NTP hydrolase)
MQDELADAISNVLNGADELADALADVLSG